MIGSGSRGCTGRGLPVSCLWYGRRATRGAGVYLYARVRARNVEWLESEERARGERRGCSGASYLLECADCLLRQVPDHASQPPRSSSMRFAEIGGALCLLSPTRPALVSRSCVARTRRE